MPEMNPLHHHIAGKERKTVAWDPDYGRVITGPDHDPFPHAGHPAKPRHDAVLADLPDWLRVSWGHFSSEALASSMKTQNGPHIEQDLPSADPGR